MPNIPSFVFAADCETSRFVKISGNHTVGKCGAGERAFGVTHEGSREAPIPGITPLVAKAGETAQVYGPGESCEVVAGGVVNPSQLIRLFREANHATDLSLKIHRSFEFHLCRMTEQRINGLSFKELSHASRYFGISRTE
jgi:hypothetical protein